MRNSFFLLFLMFIINYSAQNKVSMEKFDIEKLKEHNEILNERIINDKSNIIKLGVTGEGYYEFKYSENNPYAEKKSYYKSLNLKSEGSLFYEIPVGKYRIYSETGDLISEKNYDLQRDFSVNDLIKKMQIEFSTDLLSDINNNGVSLTITPDHKTSYQVVLKNYYSQNIHRLISIDAHDGKVIKDERLSYKK